MATATISARQSPALAWTGDRLFVYGGSPYPTAPIDETHLPGERTDAAVWDPTTRRFLPAADPPFDLPLNSSYTWAIASGGQVVVVGTSCSPDSLRDPEDSSNYCEPGTYAAATYDLGSDEWDTIDVPEQLANLVNGYAEPVGTTSDGRVVGLLGPSDNREIWTFDVATRTWAQLPSPGMRVRTTCLAGDTVVVVDGELTQVDGPSPPPLEEGEGDGSADGPGGLSLRLYDLAADEAAWTSTPAFDPVDHEGRLYPAIACGDDFALVHNGTAQDAHAHSTTAAGASDEWIEAPPQPFDGAFSLDLGRGDEIVFAESTSGTLPERAVVYEYVTNQWREIEPIFVPTMAGVLAGDAITGWPAGADLPPTAPFFSRIAG
ncbi:MAG: hypothetical protein JNK12_13880 [Acidimicrobiales bacterium]|nr:hypothetical protein [Acidimicrobiales bacterium]